MLCPRQCGGQLRQVTLENLGGAEVYLCQECEGAWYPHGSLGSVGQSSVDTLEASDLAVTLEGDKVDKVDLEAEAACPVCFKTMNRFSYLLAPSVKIDECPEHGTWLDDGELGEIVDAIAISTSKMARYREDIREMRQEMNLDGIARGGSVLNPIALTMRVLNHMFSRSPKA